MISRRSFLQGISGAAGLLVTSVNGLDIIPEAHAAKPLVSIQEYSAAKGEPILVDPVYSTTRNFVGKPLSGYDKPECLSNPAVIESLMKINKRLQHREDLILDLQLLIKDAYRPQEATDDMVHWAEQQPNPEYYLGKYIARRSGHRLGNTVDLTLASCSGKEVWMGSYFDEFNQNAHFGTAREMTARDLPWGKEGYMVVDSVKPRQLRAILRDEMKKEGFIPYALEWWHFTKK